jgi:poly(3-hydroxybutyrate) depolymerase
MIDPQELAQTLAERGTGRLDFIDEGNPDRPLTLWTYRSKGFCKTSPIVLVQHGMMRNGSDYRDFWIKAADFFDLLILATEFGKESWPEAACYNNGLVFDASGEVRPAPTWGYAVLPRLWQAVQASGVTERRRAHLFGHSAGSQFVHRLMGTQPHDWLEAAIAANAGWYTLPTMAERFPDGLGGLGLEETALKRLLAFPLTVLAGDQDIETEGPSLPSHAAAKRQGPHRFARAHSYLEAGRAEAKTRGIACNWRLVAVPGIGHDGAAMSSVAASFWFEGRVPEDGGAALLNRVGEGGL